MPVGFAFAFLRRMLRFGGRLTDRERAAFVRLRAKANEVRAACLRKPVGKGNVAALEYFSLAPGGPIREEATSRANSPAPLPLPRARGGYFDPSIDPSTNRLMDTDAEYKALSALARKLDATASCSRMGVVYLFTELQPCESCASVVAQFEERFPGMVIVVEFDFPFPTGGS